MLIVWHGTDLEIRTHITHITILANVQTSLYISKG